mmetsp:Transcript_28897/g.49028  ORF Transcript_28897/g.49028 Transcript_28897/m.49028 type:complete len:83 (+) Transcript_28897:1066-1314(+)
MLSFIKLACGKHRHPVLEMFHIKKLEIICVSLRVLTLTGKRGGRRDKDYLYRIDDDVVIVVVVVYIFLYDQSNIVQLKINQT